jgi:broad specificity phosphatase PhoE
MKVVRADGRRLTSHAHTLVLLIRHAETDALGVRIAGRTLDSALTGRGRTDAIRVAHDLADVRLAAIYSSPRRRARDTAAPLASARGADVILDAAFDEVDFGAWSGMTFEDLSRRADWRLYNEQRAMSAIPAGEPPAATRARITAALAALHRRHPGTTVAVVTHAEIVRYAILVARGQSPNDWHTVDVPPASVTRLACDASSVIELARGGVFA